MSPTIHRQGFFRFYFNSLEESRMHVHVQTPNGKAKFWLEPLVALSDFRGLKQHELHEIQRIVEEREEQFRDAWHKHFTS
ncbi:MAG: DUF4160 domain-containing protein [Chloroflexota bacterium]